MFVCLCRGVSDRAVQDVIDQGARTVAEVGAGCGAGTDCGSCHETIARMIAEATGEVPAPRPSRLPSPRARACAGCPGEPHGVASAGEEKAA